MALEVVLSTYYADGRISDDVATNKSSDEFIRCRFFINYKYLIIKKTAFMNQLKNIFYFFEQK